MAPSNISGSAYAEADYASTAAFPDPSVTLTKQVVTRIPTLDGTMHIHMYRSSRDPSKEHMALVYGDLDELRVSVKKEKKRREVTNSNKKLTWNGLCHMQKGAVLARVHSECFTGEVLGSVRCDCREQLQNAQRQMAAAGAGIIIYLRQEGRGIGLLEKLKYVFFFSLVFFVLFFCS
jgi:GTP cyclohydrolase II